MLLEFTDSELCIFKYFTISDNSVVLGENVQKIKKERKYQFSFLNNNIRL